MLIKNILTLEIPCISPTDNGDKVLSIMETNLVSDLPVIEENKLVGIISMQQIFDYALFTKEIIKIKKPLSKVFIFENQHIFDAIKMLHTNEISVLPVVDENENYLGLVTYKTVIEALAKIICIKEEGYHLKITVSANGFSATEISNLIEKNDAKILSLYVDDCESISQLDIYTKIFTRDIEAVLQSLERFNYEVLIINNQKNDYDTLYEERYDNFLKFINV
jgi:predicted transcriptional regulator